MRKTVLLRQTRGARLYMPRQALAEEGDLLDTLQAVFQDPAVIDAVAFLNAHKIPCEFWSRIGE